MGYDDVFSKRVGLAVALAAAFSVTGCVQEEVVTSGKSTAVQQSSALTAGSLSGGAARNMTAAEVAQAAATALRGAQVPGQNLFEIPIVLMPASMLSQYFAERPARLAQLHVLPDLLGWIAAIDSSGLSGLTVMDALYQLTVNRQASALVRVRFESFDRAVLSRMPLDQVLITRGTSRIFPSMLGFDTAGNRLHRLEIAVPSGTRAPTPKHLAFMGGYGTAAFLGAEMGTQNGVVGFRKLLLSRLDGSLISTTGAGAANLEAMLSVTVPNTVRIKWIDAANFSSQTTTIRAKATELHGRLLVQVKPTGATTSSIYSIRIASSEQGQTGLEAGLTDAMLLAFDLLPNGAQASPTPTTAPTTLPIGCTIGTENVCRDGVITDLREGRYTLDVLQLIGGGIVVPIDGPDPSPIEQSGQVTLTTPTPGGATTLSGTTLPVTDLRSTRNAFGGSRSDVTLGTSLNIQVR